MRTQLRNSSSIRTATIVSGLAITAMLISAIAMTMLSENTSPSTLPGYSFRRSIAIDSSQISGVTDLTNFTSVLVVQDSWVKSLANGGDLNHNDAWDIAVTKEDGLTELPFEIESYDAVNGRLTIWIHHDTLFASASNTVYLYYGANAVTNPSDQSFWYTDHLGVWHLNDLQDSGPGGWHLSNFSTSSSTGILAGGRDNYSNAYLEAGNITTVNNADSLTGSIWVKVDDLASDGALFSKGAWSASTPLLLWRDNKGAISGRENTFSVIINANNGNAKRIEGSVGQSSDNDWHHIAFTYAAGQPNGLRLFIDGVEDPYSPADVSAMDGIISTTDVFRIGRSSSNRSLVGSLDEARISSVVRSPDWIATNYNNQSNPASFWTVGPAEALPSGLPVTWSDIQAKWVGGRDVEISWATANEANNDFFVIERSLEGNLFESVGEVPSKGNSEEEQEYYFHDLKPDYFSGSRILYRVRQIDYDGKASLSNTVEVHVADDNNLALEVYPNPFTDVVRVQIPESTTTGYQLVLRTVNGSLIAEDRLGATLAGEIVTWYPPSHIPSGSYIVELRGASNRVYSKSLIHQ